MKAAIFRFPMQTQAPQITSGLDIFLSIFSMFMWTNWKFYHSWCEVGKVSGRCITLRQIGSGQITLNQVKLYQFCVQLCHFGGYFQSHFQICYMPWKPFSKLPTVFCNTEPKL